MYFLTFVQLEGNKYCNMKSLLCFLNENALSYIVRIVVIPIVKM